MPATVVLQVSLGLTDVYINVLTKQEVSLPGQGLQHQQNDNSVNHSRSSDAATSATTSATASHRSKKWRVVVTALHSQCLVLRKSTNNSSTSATAQEMHTFTWLPVSSVSQLLKRIDSSSNGSGSVNEALNSPLPVQVQVLCSISVQLQEATFDVDALQVRW